MLLFVVATLAPSFSSSSWAKASPGYRLLRLTNTTSADGVSCFLASTNTGNPSFGNNRAWGASAAWTNCNTDGDPPIHMPVNITYGFLNATTGSLQTRVITDANGIPLGQSLYCFLSVNENSVTEPYYCDGLWFYRGEVVIPYSSQTGVLPYELGTTYGVFGYDTSGLNTQTGNKVTVDIPINGSANFACPMLDTTICHQHLPYVSVTHPSLSGSSAAVGIMYTLRVPEQTFNNPTGVTVYPSEWTTDLVKYSNGAWQDYNPGTGPLASQYAVKTMTCPVTTTT